MSDPHSSRSPAPLPEPGEAFGRYQILRQLGRGGMGSVFLARDTQLDRKVALKVPLLTAADNPVALERFYREARAAATLDHPHLCPVYDVGEVRGVPYLTMAFVEGRPLSDLARSDRMTPRKAAALVRLIALALQEAHSRGVVHRDLKPANILLNRRGEPVVMDFGLALRGGSGDARLTSSGAVMGTPAYMAPEQARGETESLGPACDVYSLGVILYELLTATLPFDGPPMKVLLKVASEEPPPPSAHRPDVDPTLETICRKAMARDASKRYGSMTDMAAALTKYLKTLPGGTSSLSLAPASPPAGPRGKSIAPRSVPPTLATRPPDELPPTLPWRKPRRLWLVAAGGAAVALVTLFVAFAMRPGPGQVPNGPGNGSEPEQPVAGPAPGPKPDLAWQPGPEGKGILGIVPRPAVFPRVGRWQVTAVRPLGEWTSVAWDPTGRLLACGTTLGEVRIHEADSRRLVAVCLGHLGTVSCLAWSADGKQLASGGDDKTVRLWKDDGTPGFVYRKHFSGVTAVAWAPDGKQLASIAPILTAGVSIWDADGTPGPNLECNAECVAWSPDSKQLAVGCGDKLQLFDRDGKAGPVLDHDADVVAVAWQPDGKRLVTSCLGGGQLRFWDVDGWRETAFREKHEFVQWFGWDVAGKRLATASMNGTTRWWDTAGVPLGDESFTVSRAVSGSFGPDGKRLAVAGDGMVQIWKSSGDAESNPIEAANGTIRALRWSPDGQQLGSASDSRFVQIWDTEGRLVRTLKGHEKAVHGLAWSGDGKRLASVSGIDGTVRLWWADGSSEPTLLRDAISSESVAWKPDGKTVAVGGGLWDNQRLRLWTIEGVKGIALGSKAGVYSLAYSPDDRWLAAGGDGDVTFWAADGKPGPTLKGHAAGVRALSWSPDGTRLASAGGFDRKVRLWDADGKQGPELKDQDVGNVHDVDWSPDGKRLVSARSSGIASLWEADGKQGPTLKGHVGAVHAVAWKAAERIATGGADGRIILWNPRSNEPDVVVVPLTETLAFGFGPGGQLVHGNSTEAEKALLYLVEGTGGRMDMLTLSAFLRRATGGAD